MYHDTFVSFIHRKNIAHTILRSSARITTRLNYVSHHLFPSSGFSSHNQSNHSHSGFNSSVEVSCLFNLLNSLNYFFYKNSIKRSKKFGITTIDCERWTSSTWALYTALIPSCKITEKHIVFNLEITSFPVILWISCLKDKLISLAISLEKTSGGLRVCRRAALAFFSSQTKCANKISI